VAVVRQRPPREAVVQFVKLVQEYPELAELVLQDVKGALEVRDLEGDREIIKEVTLMRVKVIERRKKGSILMTDSVMLGPKTYVAATVYRDDPKTLWLHAVRRGAKVSLGLERRKAKQVARMLLNMVELMEDAL